MCVILLFFRLKSGCLWIDLNSNKYLFIMAITKQYLKSKPVCKVTFTVPAAEANEVHVVGTFNDWNVSATPLKKLKNGNFKGTLNLDQDQAYEFRYVVDGNYINDEQADRYQWSEFAWADNGVLEL